MEESMLGRVAAPNHFYGFCQTVAPFSGKGSIGAQFTPVIAEAFDIRYLVIRMRLIKLLQPFASCCQVGRCLGNNRHERLNRPIDGTTNGTR